MYRDLSPLSDLARSADVFAGLEDFPNTLINAPIY